MLLLQKPKSFDNLVKVSSKQNIMLQDNGFNPSYKWMGYFYYIKNESIINLIRKEEN
jgi:hypothetical protein